MDRILRIVGWVVVAVMGLILWAYFQNFERPSLAFSLQHSSSMSSLPPLN